MRPDMPPQPTRGHDRRRYRKNHAPAAADFGQVPAAKSFNIAPIVPFSTALTSNSQPAASRDTQPIWWVPAVLRSLRDSPPLAFSR